MTFLSPGWLFALALIPVVIAVYALSRRRRSRRAVALAAQGFVQTGQGGRVRRHLPFALFAIALALLVVAFARPTATIVTAKRQATVVLDFDVSNSMAAADVKPSRLDAAKAVAKEFVRNQPSSIKIGVVAFGQGSLIVQPPTSSHTAVLQAIDHLSNGGGTSIGAGILTGLDAIAGRTLSVNVGSLKNDLAPVSVGYYGGSTIVLLSDGEDTSQVDPALLARVASVAGVHIETIGFGTTNGTTVRVDGFTVATSLQPATLQAISKVASGSYHQADSATATADVSKTINLHLAAVRSHTEITGIFAAGAIVLFVLGALISLAWFGRVV
ncbi:MAG: VWA domain-containing protein [Acidimicrobiaceae bacterium]|nr:VWA domain-containing protein [Acidimicrobiaceae bacterium]MBO0747843.1 VWA domain-containing protein [Acidimicrobiaceae bacterium]